MSYDEQSGRMDWRDEAGWLGIAATAGLLQWLLFRHFGVLADMTPAILLVLTVLAFWLLGVLVRIQNARGRALTGRTGFPERALKYLFPVTGFLVGLLLILYR